LRAAGLTPQLDACLVTRRPFGADETIALDAELGGGVALEKASLLLPRLSPASRRAMREMLAGDFAAALATPATREDLREMRQALTPMFARYAGRQLKARQFAESAARFAREHRPHGVPAHDEPPAT
jgi:recombinational DNA repair protein (RecF pathway)